MKSDYDLIIDYEMNCGMAPKEFLLKSARRLTTTLALVASKLQAKN